MTGTLSYQRIGVSQLMHAEPGRTIERRSGTRAATTPRKLPMASPGRKTRGRTKSITLLSTSAQRRLSAVPHQQWEAEFGPVQKSVGGEIQNAPGGWLIENGRMVIGGEGGADRRAGGAGFGSR